MQIHARTSRKSLWKSKSAERWTLKRAACLRVERESIHGRRVLQPWYRKARNPKDLSFNKWIESTSDLFMFETSITSINLTLQPHLLTLFSLIYFSNLSLSTLFYLTFNPISVIHIIILSLSTLFQLTFNPPSLRFFPFDGRGIAAAIARPPTWHRRCHQRPALVEIGFAVHFPFFSLFLPSIHFVSLFPYHFV